MSYCEVNGCKLYYEIIGEGEPLVMIRGLSSNLDHWYPQIPALSKEYRILMFDNRGIARSADSDGPYSIMGMVQDTIALMDQVGFQQAHIVSLSMGGMIAQELALNYPERVKSLVLAVTHCGGEKQAKATEKMTKIFKDMVYSPTDEVKAAAGPALFAPETLEKRLELVLKYAEVSQKHNVSAEILIKQWEAVGDFDAWDRLPLISAPTLVLGADEDALIPPENSKILADRIPHAQLKIVKQGGHMVLVEQADECNEIILQFLRSLSV